MQKKTLQSLYINMGKWGDIACREKTVKKGMF